jgi:phosphomannomutase
MAEKWLLAEPDEDMRRELQSLLSGSDEELEDRFNGRLMFGTAGLRAEVGAGPNRMNRLVVRQAAAGLVDYLLRTVKGSAEAGILVLMRVVRAMCLRSTLRGSLRRVG